MKLAFIIYSNAVINGRSNGVRSQALKWKNILEAEGCFVELINNWGDYNWNEFDAIHIFGYDISIYHYTKVLKEKNPNIFISPIIDSLKPYWLYKYAYYNEISILRLLSLNSALKRAVANVHGICVRTEHESNYFLKSMRLDKKKVFHVPLSYGIDAPESIRELINTKEDFCLHVSSLYQERKNVRRLIEAAKKYNFKLKLVGNLGNTKQSQMLKSLVDKSSNIQLLGYVSKSSLIDLYERAKVFALPSTCEGVGIVALDAAMYGCNIVMTNISGPKEYYDKVKNVRLIDPENIDEIGKGVIDMMKLDNTIELNNHIRRHFSTNIVGDKLMRMYNSCN